MALFETKQRRKIPSNLLSDRFLVPPFSVLDTKQGYWQERKRNWVSLGIKSELGRGEKLTFTIDRNDEKFERYNNIKSAFSGGSTSLNGSAKNMQKMAFSMGGGVVSKSGAEKYGRKPQQTSIFDPVVCELAYKWFSREGDWVLDPFAGGSVRGMIAGALGRYYVGVDLSELQIKANEQQYKDISEKYTDIVKPTWINGDSTYISELTKGHKFDMIFSCPPYYNLEVYSDREEDLSCKSTYKEFLVGYEDIIEKCCSQLNDDAFAIFVVGNVRDDKTGMYYDLSGDTVRAFQKAGLGYYNEGIIVNVAGTLPVRAPILFNRSRKLGKQHQQFLVFYKGNPKNIKDKFGSFEPEEESDGTNSDSES